MPRIPKSFDSDAAELVLDDTSLLHEAVAEVGAGGGGGAADWNTLANKPTTFAPTIGATATTAVAGNDTRLTAAAAGTPSVRAIGTTATTAAAGNHAHTGAQVPLTGYAAGTAGPVAAADTVNAAIAKLEARIAALEAV